MINDRKCMIKTNKCHLLEDGFNAGFRELEFQEETEDADQNERARRSHDTPVGISGYYPCDVKHLATTSYTGISNNICI